MHETALDFLIYAIVFIIVALAFKRLNHID
jgi:hypothetical protein